MMPMNMVTKTELSLSADIVSFSFVAMTSGEKPSLATVRNRLTATAMVSEAGMPLPLTSPTQK